MPSLSKGQIYDIMYQWAEKFFSEEGRRLVYSDKDKGDIAAVGEEYLGIPKHSFIIGPHTDGLPRNHRMRRQCS